MEELLQLMQDIHNLLVIKLLQEIVIHIIIKIKELLNNIKFYIMML
ncbi:hypothetical protein CCP3SC1AL1_680008 [Gammaproteobacteria bacterium]